MAQSMVKRKAYRAAAKKRQVALTQNQDGPKVSQEESKSTIVKTLLNMNSQMRNFDKEIESRLDKAYKTGAGKKYGYDGIT